MSAIYAIIVMFVGIMVIGFIFAILENKKDDRDDDGDDSSVVISQEVPSVFDTFNNTKH